MGRKTIAEFGTHGRSVRVFVESFTERGRQTLCRVQWREGGKLKTESLPDSRENQKTARAFAEGVAERLKMKGAGQRERLTMRELGERYVLAHPVPETWRPSSLRTFKNRWKVLLAFFTPERYLDTITPDAIDELRAAMRTQDFAINQVANHVQLLKSMFRFARGRKYIDENAIADYEMKLSRDQRRLQVPEWTNEEVAKIMAQFNAKDARRWRAYVGIVLDAVLGGRSHALLNLEWRDVDLAARTLRWRPELDKLAKDRVQPLPRDAVRALRVARVWRRRIGYTGPYVIPGGFESTRGQVRELAEWEKDPKHKRVGLRKHRAVRDRPYTYSALNNQLKLAAARAGVRWVPYLAMHGFRRNVLNNVLKITGNLVRAGQFIGDTDMRTLTRSYVRERPEDLRDVADAIALPAEARRKREVKV